MFQSPWNLPEGPEVPVWSDVSAWNQQAYGSGAPGKRRNVVEWGCPQSTIVGHFLRRLLAGSNLSGDRRRSAPIELMKDVWRTLRERDGRNMYTRNLKNLGWGDAHFENGCSDELVDAIVAWGSEEQIQDCFDAHLKAGATHVCFLPIRADDESLPHLRRRRGVRPRCVARTDDPQQCSRAGGSPPVALLRPGPGVGSAPSPFGRGSG